MAPVACHLSVVPGAGPQRWRDSPDAGRALCRLSAARLVSSPERGGGGWSSAPWDCQVGLAHPWLAWPVGQVPGGPPPPFARGARKPLWPPPASPGVGQYHWAGVSRTRGAGLGGGGGVWEHAQSGPGHHSLPPSPAPIKRPPMFLSAYTREGCVRQETERAGPRGPLCPHCAPPRLPLGPQAVTCLTEDPGCAALSCLPLALIPVGPTQDFIEGNRIAGPPNLVTVEGGWCLLSPVGYGVG